MILRRHKIDPTERAEKRPLRSALFLRLTMVRSPFCDTAIFLRAPQNSRASTEKEGGAPVYGLRSEAGGLSDDAGALVCLSLQC